MQWGWLSVMFGIKSPGPAKRSGLRLLSTVPLGIIYYILNIPVTEVQIYEQKKFSKQILHQEIESFQLTY